MSTPRYATHSEQQIPALARQAIRQAFSEALAAGQSVLMVRDGFLVEVLPDRSVHHIRELPPAVPVSPGLVIQIP